MNTTPQIENGFLRIASGDTDNDILTALIKADLTATQYQIMLVVIRKTWGWNKKEDWISLSQFVELTGKSKRQIVTDISVLVSRNILVKSTTLGKTNLLSPNKKFSDWKGLVKYTSPVQSTSSTSEVHFHRLVKYTSPTIDTITKDTITKDINNIVNLFKNVNPSYQTLFKNKTQRSSVERLIKQYGVEKLTNLILQLPAISKMQYAPSITTPYELEAKMAKLLIFLKKEETKPNKWAVTKL